VEQREVVITKEDRYVLGLHETIDLKKINIEGHRVNLHFASNQLNHAQALLIIKSRTSDEFYSYPLLSVDHNVFSFDLTDFMALKEKSMSVEKWDIYVKFISDKGEGIVRPVMLKALGGRERFLDRMPPLDEVQSFYHQFFQFHIANDRKYLTLVKNTNFNLWREKLDIRVRMTQFRMKRNMIELSFTIKSPYHKELEPQAIAFVQRNKDRNEIFEYPIIAKEKIADGLLIKGQIDLNKNPFYPLFWDLYIMIQHSQEVIPIRAAAINAGIGRRINRTISKFQYQVNQTDIIYPYTTVNGSIAFTCRQRDWFETNYYLFKENVAFYFAKLFNTYYSKKDIWIGFEKFVASAHENGYYVFDYAYKNKKHDQFYYVIQKGSVEEQYLADKKDRVLYFMSFKYFVYMFSAKLLVASETKRHSYNLRQRKTRLGRALNQKKLVFLQHGVNGLKVVRDFHKDRASFNLITAPSEYEKKMLIEQWGYDPKEVVVTGYARWDVLKDKSHDMERKKIFVMPTWRIWMEEMPREQFKESDYYQSYYNFLSSPKLHKLLEEKNLQIAFFLHPKFRDYIDLFEFDSPYIQKVSFLETPVDELIMQSSLMISDYSSAIWEMYYMKKPCLFYHFDKEDYLAYEGAYMDLDRDLFGDVAFQADELVTLVEEYAERNFQEKEVYAQLRSKYFSVVDTNNTKRVYEAIEAKKDFLYQDLPKSQSVFRIILRKLLSFRNR